MRVAARGTPGVTAIDSDGDADFPSLNPRISELVADPQALRWAHDCGWVPGTGLCQNRACSTACLFLEQREIEADRIARARRRRRRDPRGFLA